MLPIWLKDDSYAVSNIGEEILMYIQIFILLKTALFLKRIQQCTIRINYKRTNETYSFLEHIF